MINNPLSRFLSPGSTTDGTEKFSNLIQTAVAALFMTGVLIFVLFFIVGAFKWMLSSGDKNSLQNAREAVMHAIIGLIIMFALYAILKLLENFLGVCLINLDLANLAGFNNGASACTPNNDPAPGIDGNTPRDRWWQPTPSPAWGGGTIQERPDAN